MSGAHDPITELDLMAYADGRLDPLRRREVEAHLAAAPEDAATVEAIIEQNRTLREALAGVAEEPIPARLEAVLRGEPPQPRRPWPQVAAVATLLVASGLGGWWVGARGTDQTAAPPVFLQALAPEPAGESVHTGLDAPIAPLGNGEMVETSPPWFSDRVTLELTAPSLGASFAAPEMQRLVDIEGRPTVRFEIAGPDGRPLALYLQTRPSAAEGDVHLVDDPTGATAYWRDGPLVWALKGEVGQSELEALAKRIGAAIELAPRLGPVDAEHTSLPATVPALAQAPAEALQLPALQADRVVQADG